MKILHVLSVALTCFASAHALAGITPGTDLPEAETKSVLAVRALLTRCLPPVLDGTPAMDAGLVPAEDNVAGRLLGDRPGKVWTDRDFELLLLQFDDTPLCRIIALDIKPRVLGDIVLRVFDEKDTPFRQQRFRVDEDGGFAAIYQAGEGDRAIIIRVSTAVSSAGKRFATLSVERPVVLSN